MTRVTHHYGGAGHTMELELEALDEPRAAGTTDTVSVYGLPDDIGSAGGADGVTVGGGDCAVDTNAAALPSPVGYREGAGNRNKYGQWAGMDGVAWCVIFVCWCAAQAGDVYKRQLR